MNRSKLTKLSPVEIGYVCDASKPVIPFSLDVKDAGCAAPHSHPRGQLIYASKGTMQVICENNIWIVPHSQAVWVPPFLEHEVYFPGEVTLRNIFIDQSFTKQLPSECIVFDMSNLLRELILKVNDIKIYSPETPQYRLMMVIIDELTDVKPTTIKLPLGKDERLMRVQASLLKNPSDNRKLDDWALLAGASSRTLARLFLTETGLNFQQWRKRLLVQEAMKMLTIGNDVTRVAFDLGYGSLSAFIKMFRQETGISPGKFIK